MRFSTDAAAFGWLKRTSASLEMLNDRQSMIARGETWSIVITGLPAPGTDELTTACPETTPFNTGRVRGDNTVPAFCACTPEAQVSKPMAANTIRLQLVTGRSPANEVRGVRFFMAARSGADVRPASAQSETSKV